MNLFYKKIFSPVPEAFGLDISDFSMKMIKLERRGKKIKIGAHGKKTIPAGIIENGVIIKEREFVQLIKESIGEISGEKLSAKWAVVSIPEREAFLRIVQLPPVKEADIRRAIKWGAEENIPLNIEDSYYDWEDVSSFETKVMDHKDVLVVASPKMTIDSYTRAIEMADIKVLAIEIAPTAVTRAIVTPKLAKETILTVDVGALKTSITVFSSGTIRFASTIDVSGHAMSEALAKELSVSFSEAEKIKIEFGFNKETQDGRVYNALKPIIDKLIKQMVDYINFYEEHDFHEHGKEQKKITKIIFCGGAANVKNLTDYCSKKIKTEIELANPWGNILDFPIKETPEISYEKSLGYTTAIGLALRGISNN